jgi:L-ascorbate metabolism protein UlaG (beta-lactamase superfamily)
VTGTEVRIRPVRADHHHRPMPHRPNEANGHLLVGPSARVWIAGDTSLYDDMAAIPDLAGGPVDLALVPVGGWGPRLSGGHLNPATAARACALVGARAAIPVHWGTLYLPGSRIFPRGWMRRPGPAFVDALAREAPGCTPHLLAPGQAVELPG